ncbi:transmembrane protein 222-like [Watersipora subatra]|uniref:transmembrane protein 222-like n=1 Tax=Watersipora subatra TaxID=2589382 RepID=UPI00355B05FA
MDETTKIANKQNVAFGSSSAVNCQEDNMPYDAKINSEKSRFPYSIVWTPIPLLTWIFPFIGHMGICTSQGIIRDFAGPYYVSDDDMAFGDPTKYWQMNIDSVGSELWDRCVYEASEVYKGRMHNLCCDNCHSHVAMALNKMSYKNSNSWNMVKLCFLMLLHGRYVSFCGVIKTWLPFLLLVGGIIAIVLTVNFRPALH